MEYKQLFLPKTDNPLEEFVTNGGVCGILRTVACIGDSLSSGEFESFTEDGKKGYHDLFEYSWGQFMAREAGLDVLNFSRGGMTAKEYCTSFAEKMGYWDPEKKCKAYMIALGWNDISQSGTNLGDISDIDTNNWRNNKETFAGYYAQIIQRIREIEPKSRIFLITIPRLEWHESRFEAEDRHQQLLYEIADLFEFTYVMDMRKYLPTADAFFKEKTFLGGHMNAVGYLFFARAVMTYTDYIIKTNTDDFRQIGFVGTKYHNCTAKW